MHNLKGQQIAIQRIGVANRGVLTEESTGKGRWMEALEKNDGAVFDFARELMVCTSNCNGNCCKKCKEGSAS